MVHELSHAAVAKARGLPVRSITLFALGGVAQIEKEASDAKTEFWMGIAGPITSALIGLICLGLAAGIGRTPTRAHQSPWAAMLGWLGVINVAASVEKAARGKTRYELNRGAGDNGPRRCQPTAGHERLSP